MNITEIYNKVTNNDEIKFNRQVFDDTIKYSKIYGFEIGKGEHATWNNEADAFKHAYMQALLRIRFGDTLAKFAGWNHEREGSNIQPKSEYDMDTHNNIYGRKIGEFVLKNHKGEKLDYNNPEIRNEVAYYVVKIMQAGMLKLDPSGRRTPKKKLNIPNEININHKSDNSSGSECPGTYQVSGYTRSDGTKVAEHTRTCSKHGKEKYAGMRFQDIPEDERMEALGYFV